MITVHTDLKGNKIPAHSTVTVDHVEQVFSIRVKSSAGLSADTIRNLLQTKHEVMGTPNELLRVVRGKHSNDF